MSSLNKNQQPNAKPEDKAAAKKGTNGCGCCPRRKNNRHGDDGDDANGNTTNNTKKGGKPKHGQGTQPKPLLSPNTYTHKDSLTSGITGLSQLSDLPRYDSDVDIGNVDTLPGPSGSKTTRKPSTICCLCCRRKRDPNRTPKPGGADRGGGREGAVPTVKVEGNRKRKCRQCCRKFTAFLFSHIGLSLLVAAYAVLGAFIFVQLEAAHEERERIRMTEVRRTLVKRLWNITHHLNVFYPENWTVEADRVFREFQDKMYHAVKWDGWDGQDASEEPKWSFIGALLYSVTIITTIGYGHITPKTVYGRMATIGYAIVGIPLTLLCLANLGTLFGNCFRFLYKHLLRFLMWCLCPKQMRRTRIRLSRPMKRQSTASAAGSKTGLGLDGSGTGVGSLSAAEEGEVTYVTEDVDKDAEEKEKRVRVPMFVSLLIIMLYIIFGAVLLSFWEEDWDIFIGAYFCFITLSTIGFGDFVPGFDGGWTEEKAVFNAFYLIFGLALIAMCFNLMQEEVRAKCAWLARKLKLIKSHKASAPHSPVHRADVRYSHLSTLSPHKQSMVSHDRSPSRRNVHPKEAQPPSHADSDDTNNGRSTVAVTLVRTVGSPPGVSGGAGGSNMMAGSAGGRGGGRGQGDPTRGRGAGGVGRGGGRGGAVGRGGGAPPGRGAPRGGGRGGVRGGGRGGGPPPNGYNTTATAPHTAPMARAMTVNPEANIRAVERECMPQSSAPPHPQMIRRPKSVPVPDLEEGMTLLEQMGLADVSPQGSPKVRRRDRSRSPVRGRSRTRESRSSCRDLRDKGENVDGPSEDDDDDDTLDASSTASSTDLVKVANALRRERNSMPSMPSYSPAVSPATTTSEDILPAHAHPYNNATMVTFRPAVPPGHVSACALIPTTSRPPSRCQSRARSTSPVLRSYYQQGYDVMASADQEPGDNEDEETDREPEGRESTTSGGGDQDDRGLSAFSRPRPNSSMGGKLQREASQKRKPSYENIVQPRCVSPMPKPMRSPSPPKRVETPASLSMSSSTSTEFHRPPPPPVMPKPKNRVSAAQPQAF